MKPLLKTFISLTLGAGLAITLGGCTGKCNYYNDPVSKHHHHAKYHASKPQQDMIVYEVSETMIAETITPDVMSAQIHTRSSRGGTSEMGTIKFAPTDHGTKMMVDLVDLRPGKDYTIKIFQCGNCPDFSCCKSNCMNINLPMLSINEPGRLSKTFNLSNINWNKLNNAKIILTRDGGYKAAWGKIYPVM